MKLFKSIKEKFDNGVYGIIPDEGSMSNLYNQKRFDAYIKNNKNLYLDLNDVFVENGQKKNWKSVDSLYQYLKNIDNDTLENITENGIIVIKKEYCEIEMNIKDYIQFHNIR